MEVYHVLAFWTLLIACVSSKQDKTLELPAMEYSRHMNLTRNLDLGECVDRLVQYPQGPAPKHCNFKNRNGKTNTKNKPLSYKMREDVHNTSELFRFLPLCDAESANYFGLLANGDCIATEVAQLLQFGEKTAVWLNMEHYRPRLRYLKPDSKINIPDEFTHYLENFYYTEKINIGTEETLILELWFKQKSSLHRARIGNSKSSLSEKFIELINSNDRPRKIKIIRISTADNKFTTKTFKGNLKEALDYVKQWESDTARIKNEFKYANRQSALSYTFKQYEIELGALALPLTSVQVTDAEKRQSWEEIALLQIEAKRLYTTNKRYRKFCRSKSATSKTQKYCLLTKQTLRELKRTITEVHTQRRDWSTLVYDLQIDYITSLRRKLTLLEKRMRLVAKHLKKAMRSKGKRS